MTVAKKAPAKKAAAPRKAAAAKAPAKPAEPKAEAAKPKVEPAPLEAQEAEYRQPVRPTPSRFAKTPFAVVMVAWVPDKYGEDPDKPADRDFEPFEDEAKARQFFQYQDDWAKEDFANNGDILHGTVLVTDTNPESLVFDSMSFHGPLAFETECKKHFKASPEVIFSQTKRQALEGGAKAAPKKKAAKQPEVAPRKPNAKGKAALEKARQAKAPEEVESMDDYEEVKAAGGARGAALANLMKKRREQAAEANAEADAGDKPAPRKRRAKAAAAAMAEEPAAAD